MCIHQKDPVLKKDVTLETALLEVCDAHNFLKRVQQMWNCQCLVLKGDSSSKHLIPHDIKPPCFAKEGVESIGAFLYHSKTMLVLWDPSYVRIPSLFESPTWNFNKFQLQSPDDPRPNAFGVSLRWRPLPGLIGWVAVLWCDVSTASCHGWRHRNDLKNRVEIRPVIFAPVPWHPTSGSNWKFWKFLGVKKKFIVKINS